MPGISSWFRRITQPKTSQPTPAKPATTTPAPATKKPASPNDAFASGATAPAAPPVPKGPTAGGVYFGFKGNVALDAVARGERTLKAGDTGPEVNVLQDALRLAGYPIGKASTPIFGPQTLAAVKALQTASGLTPATGEVDAATLLKLEAAAMKKVKFPNYGEMFADGVLSTTLAVGFDETGNDKPTIRRIVAGLVGNGTPGNTGQGYKQLDVARATDVQLKNAGIDPATVDRDAAYFVKTFTHQGKEVKSVVRLITPTTPKAKEKFARGVAGDDLVLYAGHGRYGSGPDFDAIDSPAGNFVMGAPYAAGHVTVGPSDVRKTKMKSEYQLMLFSGCTTNYYLDDLRAVPGKTTKNLDVLASTDLLMWSHMAVNPLLTLRGITTGQSLNEVQFNLEKANARAGAASLWTVDGINDN